MFSKKKKEHCDLSDYKRVNNELYDLLKEIKKEAKSNKSKIVLEAFDRVDIDIDFRSVLVKNFTSEQIDDVVELTGYMKEALLDAQELLRKGTEYGVQLAFNRLENMSTDRKVAKSPFLVPAYRNFENNLWNVIKLRELAYGEIQRLKERQDIITKTALTEKDSMMRVRYFEDIRVLEKDILRLENEAHEYDTVQTALHSEDVLKGVLKQYSTNKSQLPALNDFEAAVVKFEKK